MPSHSADSAPSAPPLPGYSVGKTFLVSISILGLVAFCQIGALIWRLKHPAAAIVALKAGAPAEKVAVPRANPAASPSATPDTADPLAAEAERRLLASLPRPTPVPARRLVTPEARLNDLINLARTLRDRGDTSTALTRLREAQVISPRNMQIASEMAMTYEKMGLTDKAVQQWRRIYEMGESAGIYYAAAEAKLRALELPSSAESAPGEASLTGGPAGEEGAQAAAPVLSLGDVGTVDDTGNSQPLRRLKLRVPIAARPGVRVDVRDTVIQVFFYEQLKGSLVETDANVASSWVTSPVDWANGKREVLEVEYAQPELDPLNSRTKERRNYFGYIVRVYYKKRLNAVFAEPARLLNQFPAPSTLPTSDSATPPNSDLPQ